VNNDYMMLYQFRDNLPYELMAFIFITIFSLSIFYGIWICIKWLINFFKNDTQTNGKILKC